MDGIIFGGCNTVQYLLAVRGTGFQKSNFILVENWPYNGECVRTYAIISKSCLLDYRKWCKSVKSVHDHKFNLFSNFVTLSCMSYMKSVSLATRRLHSLIALEFLEFCDILQYCLSFNLKFSIILLLMTSLGPIVS